MSLNIIIDNKDVALPSDMEIVVKLPNALFKEREEDATYPLTLNLASNRNVFSFLERINGDVECNFSAIVKYGPYQVLKGRTEVTDINNEEIELFIATDKHSLWGKSRSIYLDHLDLGGCDYGTKSNMMVAFTRSLTENMDYVVCPLYDAYLPNIGIEQHKPFYNYLHPQNLNFSDTYDGKNRIFCPFLRLHYLIKKVLQCMGYSIVQNDIDLDEGFKDIIVICRNNGISGVSLGASITYNLHVPHITVFDFLQEIENKFGYMFEVNEGNLTVTITKMKLEEKALVLEVEDNINRHIISDDDKVTGIEFRDKDISDLKLDGYKDQLKILYGDGANPRSVECISNIVGVGQDTEQYKDGGFTKTLSYSFAAVAENHENTTAYMNHIRNEFRLSVYRGIVSGWVLPGGNFWDVNYPLASPNIVPELTLGSKLCLTWTGDYGLFKTYHEIVAKLIVGLKQEYEFILEKSIIRLKDLREIFTSEIVIRNRVYRCYEQEITLSNNSIVSHLLRCYPV